MPDVFRRLDEINSDLSRDYSGGGGASGPRTLESGGSDMLPNPLGSPTSSSLPLEPGQPPQGAPKQPTYQGTPNIPGARSLGFGQTQPQAAQPQSSAGPGFTPNIPMFQAPETSSFYTRLFAPVTQQVQAGQQSLQGAAQRFGQASSPSRSYEALGGQGVLEEALKTGAGAESTKRAQELVGAEYKGPRGLDRETLDELTQSLGGIQARGRSLQSGQGVADLLSQATPGLTRGALRFETERLMADPEYRRLAALYSQAIGGLESDIGRARGEAETFGTQRAGEEEAIQKSAREFLSGRRGEQETALQARVDEEQARQAALREAFGRFEETGDLAALEAVAPELAAGFKTPGRELSGRAKTAWDETMGGFEDIKGVPLMQMGISSHGHERRIFDPEWYKENRPNYTKKEWKALKARAKERQMALERAGFSPDVKTTGGKKHRVEQGEFATVKPLYFNEADENLGDTELPGWDPADLRSFVGFEEGMAPSREALASPEERERYNRIQDILGDMGRLETPEDDFFAPEIKGEAERYLTEEQAALLERDERLAAAEKRQKKRAKKARKGYKASKWARRIGSSTGSESLGQAFGGIIQAGATGDISGGMKAGMKAPMTLTKAPMELAQAGPKKAQGAARSGEKKARTTRKKTERQAKRSKEY